MHYNSIVASCTIAIGALAALGAIIWQVTHGHDADAQLTGLAGLLFGAFLRMPGQTDAVQIKQPAGNPVPVDDVGQGGHADILMLIVAVVCFILGMIVQATLR